MFVSLSGYKQKYFNNNIYQNKKRGAGGEGECDVKGCLYHPLKNIGKSCYTLLYSIGDLTHLQTNGKTIIKKGQGSKDLIKNKLI